LWQIYQTLYLLFRVQECRFTTPSQDAGITVLSMGGWDTHSSVLGLRPNNMNFSIEFSISVKNVIGI
jgi:hypothetical protein